METPLEKIDGKDYVVLIVRCLGGLHPSFLGRTIGSSGGSSGSSSSSGGSGGEIVNFAISPGGPTGYWRPRDTGKDGDAPRELAQDGLGSANGSRYRARGIPRGIDSGSDQRSESAKT